MNGSRREFIKKSASIAAALPLVGPAANAAQTLSYHSEIMGADILKTVRHFGKDNIHFVHFRNVRGGKFKFEETFHYEGQIDMFKAMEAYYKIGFKGAYPV